MIEGETIYAKDQKEFGLIAAQKMVRVISEAIDKKGKCFLAISGGRTPLPVYNILNSNKYQQILDWSKVFVFFTDERCVPKDSIENNFKLCFDNWLQFFPDINCNRIEGWLAPELAATNYEKKIKSVLDIKNNYPQFDLIFMGIGEDGHVASLFPEYNFEKSKNNYVEGFHVKKLKMNRVTLTLAVLNNAKNRLFGIIGNKKKAIFDDLLNKRYKDYPVSRLLASNANDIWLVA